MRLIELKIRNFKGIRDFTFRSDGMDASVFGQNASGKTTLADSFLWLLFGKDSLNRADFEIPDQTGRLPHEELLLPSGPDGLCATIPLQETIQALRDLGIPARLSGTAGTYLCNATMYRMLHHARSCHPKMLGGFMHLPYLPSQVTELIEDVRRNKSLELHQRADLASMALDSMLDAVRTTLTVCSSKIVLA